MNKSKFVTIGIDYLINSNLLRGCRVGLVCNPASVDKAFHHTSERLWKTSGVKLAALFGPQHGFQSDLQDNMNETPHARHVRYGVPIYSLYSDTRKPTAEMLNKIDLMVIDLQDVGTRVYTYAHTMANCLQAAKEQRVKVIVCDRPNPISGYEIEGPMLKSGYESFVGQFPIPLRHGMTIGELALLFNNHFGIRAELEVMPLEGWKRSYYQDETGLPWIMPSPNLPTLDSALVYPGSVLIEGTNLSEGRGTTRPFEFIGAPWINSEKVADRLNAMSLPGVFFRPAEFKPTFQKHVGNTCGGCQIHITNRHTFKPVLMATALLQTFRTFSPDRFAWRDPPYEYEQLKKPIDILSGSNQLRTKIDTDMQAIEIAAAWEKDLAMFAQIRKQSLLY